MSWTFARSTAVGVGVSLFLLALLVRAPAATAGVLDARWTAPTTNSDGSRLTDLASYRVYYGTQAAPCPGPSRAQVASPTSSPSANTTVRFRLTGLTTGTRYSVSVTAVDSAGNESPCSSVASAVARAEFTVSPTGTVSFGSVRAGSFADRTFTVSNTGGGTVSGSASVTAPFRVVSGTPFNLSGVGASQVVTVRFSPTSATTFSTNLRFSSGGSTVSVVTTGSGTSGGTGSDTTRPTVKITSPTSASTYTTTVRSLTLRGTAADNIGVTQVTWTNSLGGSGIAAGTSSWSTSWIVLQLGANVLTVRARDAAGNVGTASLTVTVTGTSSDTTRPTVALTAPAAGTTVRGTVLVTASVTDNVRVAGVQFKLDGVNLGPERTFAPYAATWYTTMTADGRHILTAVARDTAGNTSTSAGVSVTVANANDNSPPVISRVTVTMSSSRATIGWTTNEPSNTQVEYGVTHYAFRTPLNATLTTSHSRVIDGLRPNTLYRFRMRSTDAAGNIGVSDFWARTRSP
jgi:hypothetical protein